MRSGSERYGKEVCERRLKDWWLVQHAAPKGAADLKATASAADPYTLRGMVVIL